jgi:hypothetical protein
VKAGSSCLDDLRIFFLGGYVWLHGISDTPAIAVAEQMGYYASRSVRLRRVDTMVYTMVYSMVYTMVLLKIHRISR